MSGLPNAQLTPFRIDGDDVVLWRQGNAVRCFGDFCTHQDVKLSEFGEVEGDELVCYAHGARFGLEDGRPLCFPAEEALKVYDVKVEDGAVFVAARTRGL